MTNDLDFKVRQAMHRIEDLYYSTNGSCYVSFSGGKDSTVILALIKMSIDILTLPSYGIRAVFCDTGVELQATRDFVNWCKDNWYENIEIIRPSHTFKYVLDVYGKPMKSKSKSEAISRVKRSKDTNMSSWTRLVNRVNAKGIPQMTTCLADKDMHILSDDFDIKVSNKCCDILKKKPFEIFHKQNDIDGYVTGIRSGEGGMRKLEAIKRLSDGGKLCTATKGKYIVKMPIIDWTDEDIDEFIKKYNVPLSKAYTEYGMERTGCMGCPFNLHIDKSLKILHDHEPNRYKASMFYLKDVYIAQNVKLPFDEQYEKERKEKWNTEYLPMRNEMLKKYRTSSRLIKQYEEGKLFEEEQ